MYNRKIHISLHIKLTRNILRKLKKRTHQVYGAWNYDMCVTSAGCHTRVRCIFFLKLYSRHIGMGIYKMKNNGQKQAGT